MTKDKMCCVYSLLPHKQMRRCLPSMAYICDGHSVLKLHKHEQNTLYLRELRMGLTLKYQHRLIFICSSLFFFIPPFFQVFHSLLPFIFFFTSKLYVGGNLVFNDRSK